MPKKLSWNQNYSVGEPTLDAQHKKLLRLCNRLSTCPADNSATANTLFFEILADLSAYAREHFATEESILRACKYPRLATQEADHAEYERHVNEFLKAAETGMPDKSELQKLLSSWWKDHILISDMDYRNHVMAFNQAAHRPVQPQFSAEQISTLRRKAGLSQEAFWGQLGITRSSGSRYETGGEIPGPVQFLLQLAYGDAGEAQALFASLRTASRGD